MDTLCIYCTGSSELVVCPDCAPLFDGKRACTLCKTAFSGDGDHLCTGCRARVGQDSDLDGARWMKSVVRNRTYCDTCGAALGVVVGVCGACHSLQSGWKLCPNCLKICSPLFPCECSSGESSTPVATLKAMSRKNVLLSPKGHPVDADEDYELWQKARSESVSATDINKICLKDGTAGKGYERLLLEKLGQLEPFFAASFTLGLEREPIIAARLIRSFPSAQLVRNRFLFAAEDVRHVATPDLVGRDCVGEIKVSSLPMKKIRGRYMDQLQWQMYVLEVNRCLFAVENRDSSKLEHEWIGRDDNRIQTLISLANDFLADLESRSPS